jgi:hypothetical protein
MEILEVCCYNGLSSKISYTFESHDQAVYVGKTMCKPMWKNMATLESRQRIKKTNKPKITTQKSKKMSYTDPTKNTGVNTGARLFSINTQN